MAGVFPKMLIANRGEIAIRACRAAYELGVRTVAVFPRADRNSLHRLKADESYEIGEPGHPVRAYLSVDELVNAVPELLALTGKRRTRSRTTSPPRSPAWWPWPSGRATRSRPA